MTTQCSFCRRPLDDDAHGACFVAMADMYRAELTKLRTEIDRLRSLLIDAGVMRKGQL